MARKKDIQLYGIRRNVALMRMMLGKNARNQPKGLLRELFKIYRDLKFTRIGDGKTFINSFFPPYPSEAYDRMYSFVWSQIKGERKIFDADFSVTNKCEYRCRHCYRRFRKDVDLPLKTIQNGIRKVQNAGASMIGLTGGEPLLREDIVEIIKSVGPSACVLLYTTGYGLTLEKARELKSAGLTMAIISIDHYESESHDKIRRYHGAHDFAMDAIKFFRDVGIYTASTVIPMGEMALEDELWKFIHSANEWGVHEVRIGIPLPSGRLLKEQNGEAVRLKRVSIGKIKEIHKEANKSSNYPVIAAFPYMEGLDMFGCGAGYHYIAIESDGSVTPCVLVPLSFGNIQDEDFEIIWERMKTIFKRSGSACFMRKVYRDISEEVLGGNELPLPCTKSMGICEKYSPDITEPLPRFYKLIAKYSER